MNEKQPFVKGDSVVYPAHGVGRVQGIETQEVEGEKIKVIAIHFEQERMVVRVPLERIATSGLRALSSPEKLRNALNILKGRSRPRRMMWSRRAQEYEAKINSGDLDAIAEVVRDLFRGDTQTEQSYSERQLYQAALDRLARELAALEEIDSTTATTRLETLLQKAAVKPVAASVDTSTEVL